MNKTILLIPHYNNPQGLIEALESIDASERIDVLVVDDGSNMGKIDEETVKGIFKGIGNMFFIYMEINKGIEHALNTGLKHIKETGNYKYIARLDTGDYCLGKRFAIQEDFLDKNPSIKIVGSNVIAIDTKGDFLYNMIMPAEHEEIKKRMFLNCMLIHPTVMFHADIIREIGYYPVNRKSAEDYAFFFKIVNRFKAANIQKFLVKIEINPKGISGLRRKQQVISRIKIMLDNFRLGFYPVYGLIRSCILYILPANFIMFLKRKRV